MKIAVVGTGSIGVRYLAAIAASKSCTLCGICDINEEAAKLYAEKYAVPYFTDYKQIPEKCDADAVIINLPHWLHCEVTEFFLDSGIHVFVEKPMANTSEECRRMIAARDRSGKHLAVAQPQRFNPVNRRVKEIIKSGEFGELCMTTEFRSDNYFRDARPRWFLKKALSGGGIVMNFGAHSLDRLLYITDSKVTDIAASMGNIKNEYDIEGHAQITLKFENGVSASTTLFGYASTSREVHYYFTNGALKMVDFNKLFRFEAGQWTPVELPPAPNSLELGLEEFCKLLRGEPSDVPSAEFGLEVIDLIEKIYQMQ